MNTEYEILTSSYSRALAENVNKRLKEGWKLQGGVAVSETEDEITFAQSMTRETPEDHS